MLQRNKRRKSLGPTSSTLSFRASPSGAFEASPLVGVTGTMAWLSRVPYDTLARPGT